MAQLAVGCLNGRRICLARLTDEVNRRLSVGREVELSLSTGTRKFGLQRGDDPSKMSATATENLNCAKDEIHNQ